MIIGENKGPSKSVVSHDWFLTCPGCKYFDFEYGITGRDPKFNTACHHPCWMDDLDGYRRINFMYRGQDFTPDWCPFEIDKKRRNGIADH